MQETYYQVEFNLLSEQSEFSQSNMNAVTTSLCLAKSHTKKQCVFVSFNLSAGTYYFHNYSSKDCWLSNIFIGNLTLDSSLHLPLINHRKDICFASCVCFLLFLRQMQYLSSPHPHFCYHPSGEQAKKTGSER